jgi:hypothetical protein
MVSACQCRADAVSADVWLPPESCALEHIAAALSASSSRDRTGQSGYHTMAHLDIAAQQRLLWYLPNTGYAPQVRRFATAVHHTAAMLADQYHNRDCSVDDANGSLPEVTEKPIPHARRTLRHFLKYTLPRLEPELHRLPIRYTPQSPSTLATYSADDDIIHVGNDIIRHIRAKRYTSVLSTLHHEKTHYDSAHHHRPISEPIVNNAITLASRLFQNSKCPFDSFQHSARLYMLWETDDDGRQYVIHEDELYARIAQIIVTHDTERYGKFVRSHVAGISTKFPPAAARIIYDYIEATVRTDMPNGYATLTNNLYSDPHYQQVRIAMSAYHSATQTCQQAGQTICAASTQDRILAEPAGE